MCAPNIYHRWRGNDQLLFYRNNPSRFYIDQPPEISLKAYLQLLSDNLTASDGQSDNSTELL